MAWLVIRTMALTHRGRVTHMVDEANISSNNGLSPVWCQDIIWTNAGLLPIGPLRVNSSENSNIFIQENTIRSFSGSIGASIAPSVVGLLLGDCSINVTVCHYASECTEQELHMYILGICCCQTHTQLRPGDNILLYLPQWVFYGWQDENIHNERGATVYSGQNLRMITRIACYVIV